MKLILFVATDEYINQFWNKAVKFLERCHDIDTG